MSEPLSTRAREATPRRTVAGRLLASYVVVLIAFAITLGWSWSALSEAAREAKLLRGAYVPIMSTIGKLLAAQDVMNTQLNHITSAKNPADVEQWLQTALRARPATFNTLRAEADKGLPGDHSTDLRGHVIAETKSIEQALASGAKYERLFKALAEEDSDAAQALRDELVDIETDAARRLRDLRARTGSEMTALTVAATQREERSRLFLIALSVLTFLVGVLTSIYARRVLRPLTTVTKRARAVAGGDLAPREIVATDDEIGELAHTFEDMVAAIRKARAELVQAERLATIGKMAAHITHEVRNPLSSIGLNLEMLEEELVGAGAESKQLLSAIKKEVDRLSSISEGYLSAVREPKLQLASENVDDLVRECHAFVQPELERAGVDSRVEVNGESTTAMVDEAQLRQALVNLVRNAREAMPKGGEVVLRVQGGDGDVHICIDDNGPGIPDDVRASIFDPFYTTKRHGTGLGLAVTRSIIQAHGGDLTCLPRDGGGTRFQISLPLAEEV